MATAVDLLEYAIRSQLKWKRDGTDWVLWYGRHRVGHVVPDAKHPGMFRWATSSGRLSDMANISWSSMPRWAQPSETRNGRPGPFKSSNPKPVLKPLIVRSTAVPAAPRFHLAKASSSSSIFCFAQAAAFSVGDDRI